MVADTPRVPHADFNLVAVPDGVPPLRVAAASGNLADARRRWSRHWAGDRAARC